MQYHFGATAGFGRWPQKPVEDEIYNIVMDMHGVAAPAYTSTYRHAHARARPGNVI